VKLFRREVAIALKVVGVIALMTLIVLPASWGYGQ
jgi:hypothetical protein